MRLLDLFESAVVINVNEDKTPITIKATERFKKEAQKFARHAKKAQLL
jgi:hypothetical protein